MLASEDESYQPDVDHDVSNSITKSFLVPFRYERGPGVMILFKT